MSRNNRGGNTRKPETNEPVKKFKVGSVEAAIWENRGDNGAWHSLTVRKSYQDDQGNWHDTDSFGLKESCQLATVVQMAAMWMANNKPAWEGQNGGGSEAF